MGCGCGGSTTSGTCERSAVGRAGSKWAGVLQGAWQAAFVCPEHISPRRADAGDARLSMGMGPRPRVGVRYGLTDSAGVGLLTMQRSHPSLSPFISMQAGSSRPHPPP